MIGYLFVCILSYIDKRLNIDFFLYLMWIKKYFLFYFLGGFILFKWICLEIYVRVGVIGIVYFLNYSK